ncbi:MAG: hypothetical protein JWR24_5267 [Actinoallomurus sp.]|nr:hypothetical protein [Actinoallomurus sp.]
MTGSRRKTAEAPGEELLSTSPFEGDLAEELAAAPRPRRRPPSVTVLLGAGVLIVAGFIGGVQADKHWGTKKSPGTAALINQFAARRSGQGGQGFGGNGGGGGSGGRGQSGGTSTSGSGNGTAGTVKLVDGDIIYVQTTDGVVRVKTTGSTKITIARKAAPKDLKAGSPIVVQGTPGQDGTVTATSVSPGG